MTPPWSGPIETAWKACFWVGSTLVLLAVTGGIWSTDLKVANPQFLLPILLAGLGLLFVPAVVAILEAWGTYSSKKTGAAPALTGFKITVKEPLPDKKYTPPVQLTGTINKKLPEGLKLWLINEGGSATEVYPQTEVVVQRDNWRNWSAEYTPALFADGDKRTMRIFVMGQDGLALIRAYEHINRFHKRVAAGGGKVEPGGWSGIPVLTKDMKPVSPHISFRLAKAS
jgi:hypothetical protein